MTAGDDFLLGYFSGEDGSVLHFEAEFVVRCPRSDQTTRNGDALRFQLPDDPLVVEEVLLRLRGIPMREFDVLLSRYEKASAES